MSQPISNLQELESMSDDALEAYLWTICWLKTLPDSERGAALNELVSGTDVLEVFATYGSYGRVPEELRAMGYNNQAPENTCGVGREWKRLAEQKRLWPHNVDAELLIQALDENTEKILEASK